MSTSNDEMSCVLALVVWGLVLQQAATGCGMRTASTSDVSRVEAEVSALRRTVETLENEVHRLGWKCRTN